jgi:hypothetical protein
VVDTGMQAQIRAADPEGFPDHSRFVDLYARDALASPAAVAGVILRAADSEIRFAGATRSLKQLAEQPSAAWEIQPA